MCKKLCNSEISPDTFIEVIETGERYLLKTTDGIPLAPEHHFFQSQKDWRYFTLVFPPLPQKDCTLNIIEIKNVSPNDFNYYNIPLKMQEGIEVL